MRRLRAEAGPPLRVARCVSVVQSLPTCTFHRWTSRCRPRAPTSPIPHSHTFPGTCVGERNYRAFFTTVTGAVLLCALALGFCAYRIVLRRDHRLRLDPRWGLRPGMLVASDVAASGASWLVAVVALVFLLPLCGLLVRHVHQVRRRTHGAPKLCGAVGRSALGRADASLEDSLQGRLLGEDSE